MLSEQKYLRSLYIGVQVWKDPLAARIVSRNITSVSESQFLTLFGNLEELIIVNTTLLSSILMRLQRWSNDQTIGDIFTLMLPELRYKKKLVSI